VEVTEGLPLIPVKTPQFLSKHFKKGWAFNSPKPNHSTMECCCSSFLSFKYSFQLSQHKSVCS